MLLNNDIYDVTIVDVKGKIIRYMNTKDAIIQRHVDEKLVSFYEKLGFCFGREKSKDNPELN